MWIHYETNALNSVSADDFKEISTLTFKRREQDCQCAVSLHTEVLNILVLKPSGIGVLLYKVSVQVRCHWRMPLPCNSVENLFSLSIYLFWIDFSFPPFWEFFSFDFICVVSDQSPTGWSALSLLWHWCSSHTGKIQAGQDVRHMRERILILRKLMENTSLLFLCHLEGLLRKLPCRACCSEV